MKQLLHATTAYRAIGEEAPRAALVVFPDGKYLRELLRECAKAFFRAEGRVAELIEEEHFADCLFFPAAGERLSADDCAAIVEESLLAPTEGGKKLFVLDRIDEASALVQNKLLKILEEPPAGVSFLLGAQADLSVLPTVLSRVRKYAEAPFAEEAIERALQRKYPDREVAQAAGASGGIFSAAETFLRDGGEEFALARRFLTLKESETLCREIGERKEKQEFLAALKSLLRDMLMAKAGQTRYVRTPAAVTDLPMGAIVAAIGLVGEAEKQIRFNANFASCLYVLACSIKEEKEKWQKLSS